MTPSADVVLWPYATWTQFAEECGISRVWGGTHFMAAIDASAEFCPRFGDSAYEFVSSHIAGDAD